MDKKRTVDRELEERMKKLICQAQEAERELLAQEAEWMEQEPLSQRAEQELEALAGRAESSRRLRSIRRAAASIAAAVAVLLLTMNFQNVVQAAEELIQWVESRIESHGSSDYIPEITTETEEEGASGAGTEQTSEDGQKQPGETDAETPQTGTEAVPENSMITESIGSLRTDEYMVIGDALWIESMGPMQIIHFQKAEQSYFELWDMANDRYCGSLQTIHTEWDFERGHWYVFSEDCSGDGKLDIVMLQVRADAGGTCLSLEYLVQEDGRFYSGGQAEYRTEQALHTYRYGDVMKVDLCYASVKGDAIAISYMDRENDGQCFYVWSQDGGATWERRDTRYEELTEGAGEVTWLWHQDLGGGNAHIILGEGSNVGAGQKKTYIYALEENRLTLLAVPDAPDSDYIRCCYFVDESQGYISYRYRTQPQPVVYKTTDGGAHWNKEEIRLDMEEYAYGEVWAFREEEDRLLLDVYVSRNAQGEAELRTIAITEGRAPVEIKERETR